MVDYSNDISSFDDKSIKSTSKLETNQKSPGNFLFTKSRRESEEIEIPSCITNMKPSVTSISKRIDNVEDFSVSQNDEELAAKKLYEFLERNIELTEEMKMKKNRKKKKSKGIKLLASSIDPLFCDNEIIPNITLPKKRQKIHYNFTEEISKCQEVAVDPKSIIAKTETKFWSERQKGTVFKYKKMSDGTLIEQS